MTGRLRWLGANKSKIQKELQNTRKIKIHGKNKRLPKKAMKE
jgi:hypothetical protein